MLLTITTRTDSYIQFITVLLLFVFILGITYLVTRWIAKFQKERVGNGNLEVIETCRITQNKYVQILRAGKKYLVIAVGKDEIHMLSEVSEDELVFREETQGQMPDFAGVLEQVRKLKEKEKD
ncbi:MAG: flagellar biosynthetic protein FliO [Lachnospiraceae bacterium]|nr:flagellar biosynthetic protein FliO [Lachnospiraceae bacterium]